MQMAMCTRETGKMIKHMEGVSISIRMDQAILGNGLKMCNMAMEYRNGLINPPLKGISSLTQIF